MKYIPIKNYPNYEIAKDGSIRSIDRYEYRTSKAGKHYTIFHHSQKMKPQLQTKEYYTVPLCDKWGDRRYPLIHRLVAEHFLPDFKSHQRIFFRDGNHHNYKASNLYVSESKHNR